MYDLKCFLTSDFIALQVAVVESAVTAKAERNATVTAMIICCGFIVCWTCKELTYFLLFFGYKVQAPTWFYHFTSVMPLRQWFFRHSSWSLPFYLRLQYFPFIYVIQQDTFNCFLCSWPTTTFDGNNRLSTVLPNFAFTLLSSVHD